eukprot:scaffold9866_cov108-Isochrysis_galbana.AAC.3
MALSLQGRLAHALSASSSSREIRSPSATRKASAESSRVMTQPAARVAAAAHDSHSGASAAAASCGGSMAAESATPPRMKAAAATSGAARVGSDAKVRRTSTRRHTSPGGAAEAGR